MTKRKPTTSQANVPPTGNLTPEELIAAYQETWRKTNEVIIKQLDKLLSGEAEMNASTATAIEKFLALTKSTLESGTGFVQQESWVERLTREGKKLPTFDDDPEDWERQGFAKK